MIRTTTYDSVSTDCYMYLGKGYEYGLTLSRELDPTHKEGEGVAHCFTVFRFATLCGVGPMVWLLFVT